MTSASPIIAFSVFALLLSATPKAFGTFTKTYETRVIRETRSGPANYHKTYAAIQNTVVTLCGFGLKTDSGQVVSVDTSPMTVDLQDLIAFGRGLLIDTRGVPYPGGASEIDVVEIESRICGPSYYNSADGGQCHLKTPKFINFYTTSDYPNGFSMGKDEYLVKINFSALNAIQIENVVQTSQQFECCSLRRRHGKGCTAVGPPITRRYERCELANRRHPIERIVRKVDEF